MLQACEQTIKKINFLCNYTVPENIPMEAWKNDIHNSELQVIFSTFCIIDIEVFVLA